MTDLKQKYIDLIVKDVFGESMRKHFETSIDIVVELENGELMAFDKPHINTDFCYGYDEYKDAQIGTDTYGEAVDHAHNGPDKEEFFYTNLKDVNRHLEVIEAEQCFVGKQYYRGPDNIVGYALDEPMNRRLTGKDLETVKNAVLLQKEHFVKRLETYWKRFGNSKLNCWSYSVND